MRRSLFPLAMLTCLASSALADSPSMALMVNHTDHEVRVQLALGNTSPCDSSDNRIVFDGTVGAGEARSLPVGEDCVCARHTIGEWTTEFAPSLRVCGAVRCTGSGRGRSCVRDPSQPIRVDVYD